MWLAETLSYKFNDARLLQQALTHRSCHGDNNERLEFLGDAVLDLVVSDLLFNKRTAAAEGDLSRLRASLVNKSSLAELASELGLGEFLILGEGERKTGGHRRESILADALEALFGAVYVDAGFAAATAVIRHAFGARLTTLPVDDELRDPKTRLQEWLQGKASGLPDYELIRTSGKAHRQLFEVRCSIQDGRLQSTGCGSSRRNAEQESAEKMLAALDADDAS
ncbi:MAG: ribonuclease III [Proteobacteria bacterium]|nr:ribonuclease III [Pseudomonadota bacterium]MDA1063240.1 ribonuclease III [Pseudomonadota bacterium]